MDIENKSLDELRDIAKGLGIKVHHAAKEKSIIKQIKAQQPHRIEATLEKIEEKAEEAKQPEIHNTEEDIMNALGDLQKRAPALKVTFPGDGTWIASCAGSEDSGNMSIPLRVIVNKVTFVARGRRALRSMGRDPSDKTYAGTIIAG